MVISTFARRDWTKESNAGYRWDLAEMGTRGEPTAEPAALHRSLHLLLDGTALMRMKMGMKRKQVRVAMEGEMLICRCCSQGKKGSSKRASKPLPVRLQLQLSLRFSSSPFLSSLWTVAPKPTSPRTRTSAICPRKLEV